MIALDTNALSEPFRPRPDATVLAWLAANPDAVVTAISVGELLRGVAAIPDGARRVMLEEGMRSTLDAAEVLAYDETAARIYAELHDRRRRAGRPLAVEDGMIAATCIANGARLATRNVRDFAGLGLELVNPWEDPR